MIRLSGLRGRLTGLGGAQLPELVFEDITGSARYQSGVSELADRLELSPEDVDRRARACLREMIATQSRPAIDSWGQLGAYLSRAYKIDSARPRLEEVRQFGDRHPLVFLPNHRSYLDPLVLRPALLENGFPPNYVLGGINLSFWPLGPLARRSGFVFIRRSLAGDEIYKWVLREYLGYLLRKRFNLEWYIEGGRSRTGKLRPPRYGLLTYLVQAFVDSEVDDVYIVPVSITYDHLFEVGAMAAEARGGLKRAESLPWLVGYVRAQGRQRGQVYLDFGEPLSLAGEIGDGWAAQPAAQMRLAVQKLGIEVMHRIDSVTPVTAMGLVTLCLLGLGGRALTIAEIKAVLLPLLDYIRRRDLPSVGELHMDRAGVIRQVLETLVSSGTITCYDKGTKPVYQVAENQDLVAAFYRNSIIHFLVNRAVTELVLQAAAEEHYGDPAMDGWQEALRLRDLLKFEFFFSGRQAFGQEIRSELALIDEQWTELLRSPDAATRLLEQARPHLAHRILAPFLEAYLVVADRLAAYPSDQPVEEKAFIRQCLDVAHQLLMQQRISSSESLSSELFATGLRLARSRGLADPGGGQVAERRAAFAGELEKLVRRLHRSRALALNDLDPAPPGSPAYPAPAGPSTAAFFDLDGTVVEGYTAEVVYRDRLRHLDVSPAEFGRTALAALDMRFRGAPLDALVGVAFEALAGRMEDELNELGERLFRQDIASRIYPQARQLVHAHRKAGHRVVLATSATPFQADPVAADVGFGAVLCTRPKVQAGLLTGEVDGDIPWGPGKARAVASYAQREGIRLADSFAYSNGTEDVPLLMEVGHPRPLNPQPGLVDVAHMRGWPIVRLEPPRRGFGLVPALRTGAALTALGWSATLGAGIGLLNRNRQAGANVGAGVGSNIALAAGGVTLNVTGEQNLWSDRPAVFMFNHQSSLDMLVLGDLLRRDFTGVAKKELARDPRFAPIGWLVDIAYVDRQDTQKAKEALQPAVDKLRRGISIAIAPEGTRSPTPVPGLFKKGAFHIAIQAGVPIIPVVIRNTGELMWRNSFWLHPGTVDVAVMEPVPTSGWTVTDLDHHVAYVRQCFLQALDNWPGDTSGSSGDHPPGDDRPRPPRS